MAGSSESRVTNSLPSELLDHLSEGCQIFDFDWKYLYANATAAAHGRTTPDKLIGRSIFEAYPWIRETEAFEVLKRCMDTREFGRLEAQFPFPDGSMHWFDVRVHPIPQGIFTLSTDIEQQKRAEAEFVSSREEYRSLVENLEAVVYFIDNNGFFTYISPAISSFGFSASELIGKHFSTTIAPEDLDLVKVAFVNAKSGTSGSLEFRMIGRNDERRWVNVVWRVLRSDGQIKGLTGLLHDVTKNRNLEDQLRAAQKLETIGRLAGGVAHDFNNILSVILSYATFAIDALPAGSRTRSDVEQIHKAGMRAASLTRQLLAFSRKQVLKPEILNLNTTLVSMQPMLARLLGEDVELHLAYEPTLGKVSVDPGQIEQVIMNLLVNARDAMPRGGRIRVETSNVDLDEDYVSMHLDVKRGPHVLLTVSDNGSGMDEETKARIFEPFFTTKAAGKGTGLGLSTVFGIVKQSGGNIFVYSEVGKGTIFKIYFPRVMTPLEMAEYSVKTSSNAAGGETVLITEDEETVRVAAERILSAAGYRVIVASNGKHAMQVLDERPIAIDVLLTDVVMPGMSGGELATKVRERHPDVCVIYMSGYTDDSLTHHGVLEQGHAFVNKPFSAADLTKKVRDVLDGRLSQLRSAASSRFRKVEAPSDL